MGPGARGSTEHAPLQPAAIIVLLDMVEAGEVQNGVVPFETFEQRFERLLKDFGAREN